MAKGLSLTTRDPVKSEHLNGMSMAGINVPTILAQGSSLTVTTKKSYEKHKMAADSNSTQFC